MVSLTLGIEKVADGHWEGLVGVDGSVLEHLLLVSLRSNTHILLAEVLDMSVDVGAGQLL